MSVKSHDKLIFAVISIISLFIVVATTIFFYNKYSVSPMDKIIIKESKMKITSNAFADNNSIPKKYTCDGENISPALSIGNIPDNTKTMVLVMDDPDSPSGNFLHWMVWNINPNTNEITENTVPASGIVGFNDFGELKYGGPCPKSDEHHYHFKIYAINTNLNLSGNIKREDLEKAINGHILDKAILIGTYKR
ncbi:MAG: YbhB/YbcL family Raf kinase inhibitor-like protein [bacterium]|nr:YbhB/YbcL family Raf kinase inhibitor-like protein [bacterium]